MSFYTRRLNCLVIALMCLFAMANQAGAQQANNSSQTNNSNQANTNNQTNRVGESVNYEIELTLLTTTNETSRLPARFEAIGRQLQNGEKKNHRVATTFIHRVQSGKGLEVRGIAGNIFDLPQGVDTPAFYEFVISRISANAGSADVNQFRFGTRVPVTTGKAASGGGFPVTNYEPTGITSSFSVRENVPTLIGTLTLQGAGEMLAVVMTVRRAS